MEILAEAVRFFAGGRQILQGIDLELRPKEFLGIIGPNGSGKSTFLKCVYRVQKPTTGKIYFNGKKLDEFSYLFDIYNQFHLSCSRIILSCSFCR